MASNGKVKKQHRLLEQNPDSKFARALGSVDFHTREAGLAALASWLSKRHDIEEQELLLLWKGIFYCFWHSDKGAVQAALAERLSEILTQLPEQVGWLYYATFVRTMRREWFGIDRLRLDKFMMLIRKFFAASLRQLQQHDWQPRRVQRLADFWLAEILVPHDTLNAAGVAFHLSDLLLPELANCLQQGSSGSSGAAPDDATLRTLLEPFCRALAAAPAPALIHRLRQGVFDPLVCEVQAPGEPAALRNLDVPALAAHLFELGSQAEARARNREALYAVSAALEKAAAQQAEQAQRGEAQKGGKAQQRKEQQRRRQQEQEEQAAAAMEAEAPEGQQHAADAQQQQQQAAGELTPVKSKKGKKRRQAEGEAGVAPSPATASTPPAAAAAAPAAEAAGGAPPTSSKKKKKSRFAGVQHAGEEQHAGDVPVVEQDLLAAALAAVTGTALPAGTPGGDLSPSKKSVRFSLRRNVVNVIGQPPKPADVRTPPTAKPKGSALKREGLIGGPGSAPERLLTRAGMGRMAQVQMYVNGRQAASAGGAAPGSASRAEAAAGGSSKKQKQKRRASLPAPGSFSRPRASEFF